MEALQKKARALLEAGTVKVVIGYAAGSDAQRCRAIFARQPEQAQQLIWDARCKQNLAAYLVKPEVKALGKPAIVARNATLRTLLQYAAESQLTDEAVLALAVSDAGIVTELPTFAAIEEYLAQQPRGLTPEQQQELARMAQLPLEERWAFWAGELSRCMKCYACRAACPLCYCTRCIVDVNQPQWIPVASTELGNLEWNVVRAMHLAGRCVDCGSCAEACPEGIRLDLLNRVLAQEALTQFGAEPGYTTRLDLLNRVLAQEALTQFGAEPGYTTRREYALSAYKPDDKEEFIR